MTSPFYHGTIRKYNVMIGTLFNDISIQRFDNTGAVTDTLEVPIAFAPKEEFITLIKQYDPIRNNGIQLVLPRMSFEMTSFNYAPDRMQSTMHKMKYCDGSGGANAQYAPVSYDFLFDLHIATKNLDDNLQILEQILPSFNPTVNFPVKNLPELHDDITHDIAIELTGNDFSIDYEGGAKEDGRLITQSLSFTLRGYLFRENSDTGGTIIKTAITNYYDFDDCGDLDINKFLQKKVTFKVNPETAGIDDPHTIDKTNEDF